jgi:uncharacterized ParB-like nuclease family protein
VYSDPLATSRDEFDRVHRKAFIKDLLAQLRGEPVYLLPFEEVRQKLRLSNPSYRGLQEVQLDHIIGSFARYHDFTRAFLPRQIAMRDRWVTVHRLAAAGNLPPVELYQVGDTFFVSDGHHRISVVRRIGAETIQAHVYEYQTRVPLEPETTLDDLLIKEEYVKFLENTGLDESRPEHRIRFTSLGRFRELEFQIALYQAALSLVDGRPFGYKEAAAYWYDMIYTTILQIIHHNDMLKYFPGRSEADLFVWVTIHQRQLSEAYGYEVQMIEATDHVKNHHGNKWPRRLLTDLKERLSGHPHSHRSAV